MNNKGQMLIIELIFFASTIILALIFIYQLSPTSVTSYTTSDLKVIGDNALYALYNDNPPEENFTSGHSMGKLASYVLTGRYTNLVTDLNNLLPSTVIYNIYLSNTSKTIFWCNSNMGIAPLQSVGSVSRSHCIIALDPDHWSRTSNLTGYPVYNTYFSGCTESAYDLILEMWYI